MNWTKLPIFLAFCIVVCLAHAANDPDAAVERKLAISKRVWSPVFSTIDFGKEGQRLPIGEADFQRVNEAFYRAYAEYLDEPELVMQEKMYQTAIGKRIANNMIRTLFGLQPFTLTYDSFSTPEKNEWEAFSRDNITQIRLLENKMKGFSEFMRRKLADKTAPSVQGK